MFPELLAAESEAANFRRWKNLKFKVQEHRLEEVWRRFTDAGFKPLLIKGWAAARYYTEPSERQFSDIDLAFAPMEFRRAVEFLKGLNGADDSIDLHEGTRQLDTLPFETLHARSQTVGCGATQIKIPSREDHLRILCVHWLLDGGAKKDKLWDIFYAVSNRPQHFDWDACLNVVSPTRRRWIVCAVGLAEKYLNLDVRDTPLAGSVETLPQWLAPAVEKEWRSEIALLPLHFALKNPKTLWRQIKKRVPPNPIQATVEMEGEFDEKPRAFYQIGSFFQRLAPSIQRIFNQFKKENR